MTAEPVLVGLKDTIVLDRNDLYSKAVKYIKEADGLLITGGAGMGVDSGLPDFRGNEGFWKAYPALATDGCSFIDIAQPLQFKSNPERAWGFYGHRLNLYRQTMPHNGFRMLRELGEQCSEGYFVFTSNVDGQYQKSGFDPTHVLECHGSIHHLQCTNDCINEVWTAEDTSIEVDQLTCSAINQIPLCPCCGEVARPNILMFDDYHWNDSRELKQRQRFDQWLSNVQNLVIIECGAGTAIPSVRRQGDFQWGNLIRINLREAQANKGNAVCIETTALEAITEIYTLFNTRSKVGSI